MSYSSQAQQNHNGGVYSFSVHQPYTNWPLHSTPSASSYASWYQLAQHQAFASTSNTQTAKSYKDAQTHTEDLQANIAAKEQRPYRPEWNKILSSFFEDAGLFQALSGLKDDLLVMNEEWERVRIPEALHVLVNDLSVGKSSFNAAENDSVEMMQLLSQELVTEGSSNTLPEKPLAEKKLEAIKPQNGSDLHTPPAVSGSSEISRTWVN